MNIQYNPSIVGILGDLSVSLLQKCSHFRGRANLGHTSILKKIIILLHKYAIDHTPTCMDICRHSLQDLKSEDSNHADVFPS